MCFNDLLLAGLHDPLNLASFTRLSWACGQVFSPCFRVVISPYKYTVFHNPTCGNIYCAITFFPVHETYLYTLLSFLQYTWILAHWAVTLWCCFLPLLGPVLPDLGTLEPHRLSVQTQAGTFSWITNNLNFLNFFLIMTLLRTDCLTPVQLLARSECNSYRYNSAVVISHHVGI